MTKPARLRVSLLGLGLIGGSIARALRRKGADHGGGRRPWVVAWSPSGAGPDAALRAGAIDEVSRELPGAVADADLIVIAAPPLGTIDLLDWLAGPCRDVLSPEVTITDVASTKRAVVARARALGLPFVGGHPMAGREQSGFGSADSDLFVGRPWVVVPDGARSVDILRVEWLVHACGAHPVPLAADLHDQAVAGISHLPLVVATALVEAVVGDPQGDRGDWPLAGRLAAGGWGSVTRLARGDATMGAGILATNADAVARRVRDLRTALDRWLELLDSPGGPDAAALEERLLAARRRLEG